MRNIKKNRNKIWKFNIMFLYIAYIHTSIYKKPHPWNVVFINIYLFALRQNVILAQSTTYGWLKPPAMVLRPPECYDYRLSYNSQIYKLVFTLVMFLLSNLKIYEVIIFWIFKIFELSFLDELKVSQNCIYAKYMLWETMLCIASFFIHKTAWSGQW